MCKVLKWNLYCISLAARGSLREIKEYAPYYQNTHSKCLYLKKKLICCAIAILDKITSVVSYQRGKYNTMTFPHSRDMCGIDTPLRKHSDSHGFFGEILSAILNFVIYSEKYDLKSLKANQRNYKENISNIVVITVSVNDLALPGARKSPTFWPSIDMEPHQKFWCILTP